MTRILHFPREWCTAVDTQFRLRSNSLFSAGINPGAADVYGPQAQVWTATIPIAPMKRREDDIRGWQKVDAFFTRAAGISGLIRMFDPKRIRPGRDIVATSADEPWSDDTLWTDGTGWSSAIMPPFCTVYEAAEAGADSIVLAGLPVSTPACLWAGDLLEIRPNGIPTLTGSLYQADFDAPTNSAGRTRVSISPTLRKAVAAGDMVRLDHATTVFRAIDDDQGLIAHSLGGMAEAGFSLIEVLP